MTRARALVFAPVLLAISCADAPPARVPPQATLAPTPTPVPTVTAAASAAAPQAGYKGLGVESVPPEILAEFPPKPLPPEVSRRIQSMLDVRAPSAGRLSPDGSRLFFGWNVTGSRQVWRLDGPQRFPVQLTGGEDATDLAAITLDGKQLVLARDRAGEENPGLYLARADGGPLEVVQHLPGIQTFFELFSDDGKWLYFRSNDKKKDSFVVYRIDLATKKREVVLDQPGLWDVYDLSGDKLLVAKFVGARMAEIYELDLVSKALTPLFGQGEREDYVARWGASPGEVLVLTPKFGDFKRLYRFRRGAAPAAGAASDPRFVPITPEAKHDVEGFAIDRKRARIYVTTNENGFSKLKVLDAKTLAEIKLPEVPKGDHVRLAEVSHDGRFANLQIETSRSPGRSFAIDWKAGKAAEWHAPSAPEIDTSKFAEASAETYPARDGTKIPMLVRRPAKCAAPCPVVVMFHGGPEGQTRPGFDTRAQMFVDAGFVYAAPNVRGSDGLGKAWIKADDGKKRAAVLTDIEDAAIYIKKAWAHEGKPPKVGVFGGSYGGYSVQVAMTMFAGAYDAGVSVVGISNLLTFLQNTAAYRRSLRASEYGDPETDKDVLLQISPITHVDKVKGPMLLMQGATDPRVPVGEALQMHRALVRKGLASELMIFPDEGHGAQKRGNQVLMIGHAVRFFQQHLQAEKGR